MKIKSLLVGMLACTALVGCSNEDEVLNGAEAAKGEKGYIAVNFAMPGGVQSRATTDGNNNKFESGTREEVAVKDAVFLFLDGDFKGCAKPYYIANFSEGWADAAGTGVDKENKVVVVEGAKGEVPSYIVAILNPTDYSEVNYNATTTLADLKNRFATYRTAENFVMSNAVYQAGNNKEMVATPVELENIAFSEDGLKAENYKPVTIQVERVVAKVAVTGLDAAIIDLNENGLKETIDDAEDMKLKFVLTGWEVLQANESRLIKNIDATDWTITSWNDVALKRSYWANDYQNDLDHRTSYKVEEMRKATHKYVEETVNQTPLAANVINDANPYLLVAGKFVDAKNNPVNLVEWRGQKYTAEGYLNFIAGYAELSQYYTAQEVVKDGKTVTEYTSFSANLLELVDADAEKATDWRAIAQLKDANTTFYTVTFKADGETVEEGKVVENGSEIVAKIIAEFGYVQYWNGGNTYYFVPIKHQTATTATEDLPATNYYGVVRNHYYKVNISQIIGYGTPVSDPAQYIDSPEVPEDKESWMAATIEILDWKVVENNGVVLGQ